MASRGVSLVQSIHLLNKGFTWDLEFQNKHFKKMNTQYIYHSKSFIWTEYFITYNKLNVNWLKIIKNGFYDCLPSLEFFIDNLDMILKVLNHPRFDLTLPTIINQYVIQNINDEIIDFMYFNYLFSDDNSEAYNLIYHRKPENRTLYENTISELLGKSKIILCFDSGYEDDFNYRLIQDSELDHMNVITNDLAQRSFITLKTQIIDIYSYDFVQEPLYKIRFNCTMDEKFLAYFLYANNLECSSFDQRNLNSYFEKIDLNSFYQELDFIEKDGFTSDQLNKYYINQEVELKFEVFDENELGSLEINIV